MSQSSGLKHIPWNQVAREPLNDKIDREMLHGDKLMLARVFMKKGAHVPKHQPTTSRLRTFWRAR